MKLIQFTDVHIGREGVDTRGVDVRKNFIDVMQAISRENHDELVLTGDLCYKEPHIEIYAWIKDNLASQQLSPHIISGNHDDPALLSGCFDLPLRDNEIYYAKKWAGFDVIFLDTTVRKLSENQWQWFSEQLQTDRPVVIFMHHPPLLADVPYMDANHAFAERNRFRQLTSQFDSVIDIFCGHYHVSKSIEVDNLRVHITPSCFFQIRQDISDFGVDSYDIGYRIIEMNKGKLAHSVHWLSRPD